MDKMIDTEPVANMYKGGFFKNRHKLSWRAPVVADSLITTFDMQLGDSVIDVGCAIGDYVKELREQGMLSHGIEGSEAAREFFVTEGISVHDLREPVAPQFVYKLAFSLEVAEHIEAIYADQYLDNLAALSDTILISAATPGQKGHGHVNCAPKQYWINKMKDRGFIHMKGLENLWRSCFEAYRTKKELSSYIRNVIIFRRQNAR